VNVCFVDDEVERERGWGSK